MKYNNISKANSELKRKLLIALIEGKIKKEDLFNIDNSLELIKGDGTDSLFHVVMGEVESYNLNGKQIEKEQYDSLSNILTAIGCEQTKIITKWK